MLTSAVMFVLQSVYMKTATQMWIAMIMISCWIVFLLSSCELSAQERSNTTTVSKSIQKVNDSRVNHKDAPRELAAHFAGQLTRTRSH